MVSRLRTLWALIARVTQTQRSKQISSPKIAIDLAGDDEARCVIVVDENGTEIHKATVKL
jgi:hypothetical protein